MSKRIPDLATAAQIQAWIESLELRLSELRAKLEGAEKREDLREALGLPAESKFHLTPTETKLLQLLCDGGGWLEKAAFLSLGITTKNALKVNLSHLRKKLFPHNLLILSVGHTYELRRVQEKTPFRPEKSD